MDIKQRDKETNKTYKQISENVHNVHKQTNKQTNKHNINFLTDMKGDII